MYEKQTNRKPETEKQRMTTIPVHFEFLLTIENIRIYTVCVHIHLDLAQTILTLNDLLKMIWCL